jgi:segregation and condensation protein B
MQRSEEDAYLLGAIEALLFVSDEPVSAAKLAGILEIKPSQADNLLTQLSAEYKDEERGMQLREVAGGWRFYSHPAYHEIIENYVLSWDTRKLSQAALEALAIIAYHQPVTRNGINAVRGVNSEGVVSSLIEKGFVRELGREKGPGAAILYGTTSAFLERFGLKSIKDLPPLEDFAIDEESREYIRERLGGNRTDEGQDISLEDAEKDGDEYISSLRVSILNEDGTAAVQEVDHGNDKRVDDAEAMADIIMNSITQKADDLALQISDEMLEMEDEEDNGDPVPID